VQVQFLEMITTLCKMILFLDMTRLNTQWNFVGKEQDSGEKERERERESVLLQIGDGIGNKFGHRRKYL
jgi:hypothetical protein